jgi:guanylate kinase
MISKLVLFCGPSGSGKTTIVKHLLSKYPELMFSVSATTRECRFNEVDGKDYYFMSVEEFNRKIENKEFLEWEEVYKNGLYGTLESEIERISSLGKVAIFDIDVEGGLTIKNKYGNNTLDVIVVPPTIEELKKRLVARNSETNESLKKRIDKAVTELTYTDKFSHTLVNENLDQSLQQASDLVEEFLKRE